MRVWSGVTSARARRLHALAAACGSVTVCRACVVRGASCVGLCRFGCVRGAARLSSGPRGPGLCRVRGLWGGRGSPLSLIALAREGGCSPCDARWAAAAAAARPCQSQSRRQHRRRRRSYILRYTCRMLRATLSCGNFPHRKAGPLPRSPAAGYSPTVKRSLERSPAANVQSKRYEARSTRRALATRRLDVLSPHGAV
jgi:hypothetical protein